MFKREKNAQIFQSQSKVKKGEIPISPIVPSQPISRIFKDSSIEKGSSNKIITTVSTPIKYEKKQAREIKRISQEKVKKEKQLKSPPVEKSMNKIDSRKSLFDDQSERINNLDVSQLNKSAMVSDTETSGYDESMFSPLIKTKDIEEEDVDLTTKVFGPLPDIHVKNCGFLPELG